MKKLTGIVAICNIMNIMSDIRPDRKKTRLADGKLLLRPYRMSDVNDVYQAVLESISEVSPWLPFAHQGYAIKESRDWIRKLPRQWKKGILYDFGIFDAEDGVYLGGCGLNDFGKDNRHANLGYWVRTSRTGQGVASGATLLLAKWGFEVLKLVRIEILIAVGNARSLRVAEKVGAKREGVLRNRLTIRDKLHDAVMYSLLPEEIRNQKERPAL